MEDFAESKRQMRRFSIEDEDARLGRRRLDRWMVNLANFLQTERLQLLRLEALVKNDPKQDWSFSAVDDETISKIDDQLYNVYLQQFDKPTLAEHKLTPSKDDFKQLINMPVELIAELQTMDDKYINCFVF